MKEQQTWRPSPDQLSLPGIGPAGQQRLRDGRVLIVGVGGLGSPAALYLATAGVGTIGLIDPDVVEPSNLQRQIAYVTRDIGSAKVEAAAAAVRARNPEVIVHAYRERLTARCLPELFAEYDFVIDGTDGVEAKFLVNDGAILTGTPYSHAGVLGWVGQTMTVLPERGACYRCLFPAPPGEDDLPTCQTAGILGAVAGVIGLVQASEALKFLLGMGGLLVDRLLTYDGLALTWRLVPITRNRACPLCGPRRTITSLTASSPLETTGASI